MLATSAEIQAVGSRRFAALLDRHSVPGGQLAVYRNGELTEVTGGALEAGTGAAVTADAAFPLGSVTKVFTATLALTLVADGDLELAAPLREYLPELSDELGDRLTLTHLLSHTSGLPCNPPAGGGRATGLGRRAIGLSRYAATHCRRENLICEPGGAFSYSNLGYVVTGRIIEAVTGMSWREAMTSILLRPLGIDPAFVCFDSPAHRPVATGHAGNPASGRLRPVEQALDPVEAPAGALAVSALDLVTLGRLHLDGGRPDLLPAQLAARMRRPVPHADPFGLADGWGLGLATYRGSMVGHDGNAHGTACYLRVDPARNLVVALTANATTGYRLWQDVAGLLAVEGRGSDVRPALRTVLGRERSYPVGVGRYANGDVSYVVSTDHVGQWRLTIDDEVSARLVPGPDLVFSLIDPQSNTAVPGGRFVRDTGTGDITAIQVGGRLAARVGRPVSGYAPETVRQAARAMQSA